MEADSDTIHIRLILDRPADLSEIKTVLIILDEQGTIGEWDRNYYYHERAS